MKQISSFIISALEGRQSAGVLTDFDLAALELAQVDLLVAEGLGVHAWPISLQPALAARLRQARLESAVELEALAAVLNALQAAGIPALVLKGAAFAHSIYRRPWWRPHGDVDLLVPEPQLDAAREVCEGLGYESAVQVRARPVTGQRELRKPGTVPIALDLHGRLVNPLLFDSLPSFRELHARAVPLPALGPAARTLDTIDALLHLLVHRVAHHYREDSVVWLLDVHLLASSLDESGWREADRRVRAWQVAALAADGLDAAQALFGTRAPTIDEWRRTPGEPSRRLLDAPVTEWRLQQLSLKQARGMSAKAALLAGHFFPPADYMLARYATSRRWRLPELYVRRALEAVRRTRRF